MDKKKKDCVRAVPPNPYIVSIPQKEESLQSGIEMAREFFQTLYGHNAQGHLTIWSKRGEKKMTHSYQLPEQLEVAARQALKLSVHYDVYYGVGVRKRAMKHWERGKSSDVMGIPGVWVDIDCKEGCHKKTRLPTVQEAEDFLADLIHPPSLVVASGGGLHAYWLFDEFLYLNDNNRADIQGLLDEFQAGVNKKAKTSNWELDNVSDLARVLRVPGTFNRKSEEVKPVIIRASEADMRRYSMDEIREFAKTLNSISDNIKPKTMKALRSSGKSTAAEEILKGCAFIRHCIDNAASLSEPEWYAMVTVIARVDNGQKLCHEYSQAYPEYLFAETEQKIQHALQDTGPMNCATITEKIGGEYCEQCDHQGDIKSPIQLGKTPKRNKDNQTERLISLSGEAEYIKSEDNELYAVLSSRGVNEVYPIASQKYTEWLVWRFTKEYDHCPRSQSIKDAIRSIKANQGFSAPTKPVFLRSGECNGNIYIDLGDPEWHAVEVTADGWNIIQNPPVHFRRSPRTRSLPIPIRGGDINELKKLVTVSEKEWPLFLAFLVTAMYPTGPYPVLICRALTAVQKALMPGLLKT